MKWAIQAKEEKKNKPQTFSADGWTGNQRSSQMWWRNEQELLPLPSREQHETSELNGSGGGRGKGIRGPRPFVPVGDTNRDKRGSFCPGWWFQPGQKAPVPPLARLAVGPGTKATYCPRPKGCRDKWPGTKDYSVVVNGVNWRRTRQGLITSKRCMLYYTTIDPCLLLFALTS